MEIGKININCEFLRDSLKRIQILELNDNCILSRLSYKFMISSGLNSESTSIVVEYIGGGPEEYVLVDNDGEDLRCHGSVLISLTNDGYICVYDNEENKEIFYSDCCMGDYIKLNNRSIEYIMYGVNIVKINFYSKRPFNIKEIYNISSDDVPKIYLSPLDASEFVEMDDRIYLKDYIITHNAIDKYICGIKRELRKKRLIIRVVEKEKDEDRSCSFVCNNTVSDVKMVDDNDSEDILRTWFYNKKLLRIYKIIVNELSGQEICYAIKGDINRRIKTLNCESNNELFINCNSNNELFINKINFNLYEKFILDICKEYIYNDTGKMSSSYDYDITICVTDNDKRISNSKHLFTLIITYEKMCEDDILIKKGIGHISLFRSDLMYVCGYAGDIENKIDSSKYLKINIYKKMTCNEYVHFSEPAHQRKKPYLYNDTLKNIRSDNTVNITLNEIVAKNITTTCKDNITLCNIMNIYKNYDNRYIIFQYVMDTMVYHTNMSLTNIDVVKKLSINKEYHSILNIFKNESKLINIIDKSHELMIPSLRVFNEIIGDGIEKIYGINEKIFNMKKCFITGIVSENTKFNSVYSSVCDNPNNNVIIYASINLDNDNNEYGMITYYTNYIHLACMNYNNTKTLEYITEIIDTSDDIMTLEEHKRLINFGNKAVDMIVDNDCSDKVFKYEHKNKSWDLDICKITDIDVSNIINNIRDRIIKRENLQHDKIDNIKLPSFFQILLKGSMVHYHKDTNDDDDTYHIRFNVIIQKADEGGEPLYGGIELQYMERKYVICRSGIDYHACNIIRGKKARIAISFGFNIPKNKISNHPNIFNDLMI
jgi:hypothetical protein